MNSIGGIDDRSLYLAVVPAYNEAATITTVIEALRMHAPMFDTLVVDDGSTDDTGMRAIDAGATVLRLPFNVGIGGAVQTGFVYAREHGYRFLAQVDGDGQHDSVELERLVNRMEDEDVDVVGGSRFLADHHVYRMPTSRRTGAYIFAFLLSRIIGTKVSDPTSGFRLFNSRAIALFARDYPHDYPEVEAVLMLHHHGLRMCEVPVKMHARSAGRSSIDMRRSGYYMLKVLLALFVSLARRRGGFNLDAAAVDAEQAM